MGKDQTYMDAENTIQNKNQKATKKDKKSYLSAYIITVRVSAYRMTNGLNGQQWTHTCLARETTMSSISTIRFL